MKMKNLYLFYLGICSVFTLQAQQQKIMPPIPFMRQAAHQYIEDAKKEIFLADGKKDTLFTPSANEEINLQLTYAINTQLYHLRWLVERNDSIDNNEKYKWLRGIKELVQSFTSAYKSRVIKGALIQDLLSAYQQSMLADWNKESILEIVAQNEMEIGYLLIQNFALEQNEGVKKSKDVLVYKSCERYPDKVLQILTEHPQVPFADSLLLVAALKDPEAFYNYAANPNALGKRIQSSPHRLVKTISLFALMKSGRLYFPFLDNVVYNKLSIDTITAVLNDSTAYFSLLVNTKIDYAKRMAIGDTALAIEALQTRLTIKAKENYILPINAAHEERNPAIRFSALDKLTAAELYYVAVTGEAEMYTSSFTEGIYPRIFQRLQSKRADSLLQEVGFDHYKKFIRICAAYNTLDDFLKKMDRNNAEALMKNFARNLEKTRTLEDAVDVADSYASITDNNIRKLILSQTEQSLLQNELQKNKRGQTIYYLLNTIFLSMDSSNQVDLSARLGIAPVFKMPSSILKDSAGRINVQQFFYGDKDGLVIFNSFLNAFRNNNWKILQKPDWVEVSSVRGIPITIFANKPLDETFDLDDMAQNNLLSYLDSLAIDPTIVIHRGHSYNVTYTIDKLVPTAKVVLLGSCGGYQRLSDVLDYCPEAHIIASKQIGTGIVNQTMINSISETLRSGKDLDWPSMWKDLEKRFIGQAKEKFDDYVPPHKNLGAIFMMAYQKAMRG
jgi:hypothetical protein